MSRGTVLVTGASSGIGAAMAKQFASNDYDLVITARREKQLEALKSTLDGNVTVRMVVCDLASTTGPQDLIDAVADLDIDILVNNAGVATTGNFYELDATQINNLLMLNITALTTLTRHFLPMMIAKDSGRILNVASVAAFQPVPTMNVYAASKAYVLSLTESLSEELRHSGVSVTALCPGLTKTEMVDSLNAQSIPPFLMSSVEDVAREGYDALMAREVIRIPGMANQAAVTWAQHQPRWLVRGLGGLFSKINPIKHGENN